MSGVTITELVVTCESVPAQLEGRLSNGWHLYARSRHSRVSMAVAPTEEAAVTHDHPEALTLSGTFDSDRFGCCTTDQLEAIVRAWVAILDIIPPDEVEAKEAARRTAAAGPRWMA